MVLLKLMLCIMFSLLIIIVASIEGSHFINNTALRISSSCVLQWTIGNGIL